MPSTNHASPSGALPFLLPSPSSSLSSPSQPIPASNLPTYAASLLSLPPRLPPDTQVASDAQHVSRAHPCHGSRTDDDTAKQTASPVTVPSVLDDDHRAHAYRALLNGPIRRAFLYAAYLSPSNADAVARRLYVDGATRHPGVRAVLASRLRDAARREVWCGSWRNDDEDAAEGSWWGRALRDARGWAIAVMGGPEVAHGDEKDERVDKLYAAAESALVALDTLLRESLSQPSLETERHDQDGKDAVPLLSATTTGGWFFASPTPTLFDAEVFGYVHLLLDDGVDSNDGHVGSWHEPASIDGETGTGKRLMGWRDNKLGDVIRKRCRALVAHRERVLDRCWR